MNETVPTEPAPAPDPADSGWVSGGMAHRRALRVTYTADLIEITDGSGQDPLLSLSVSEAAGLHEDLGSVLDVVGWPT